MAVWILLLCLGMAWASCFLGLGFAYWYVPSKRRILIGYMYIVCWPVLAPFLFAVRYAIATGRMSDTVDKITDADLLTDNELVMCAVTDMMKRLVWPYIKTLEDPEEFEEAVQFYVTKGTNGLVVYPDPFHNKQNKESDQSDESNESSLHFLCTYKFVMEILSTRHICVHEIMACQILGRPITLEPLAKLMAEYAYGLRVKRKRKRRLFMVANNLYDGTGGTVLSSSYR